MSAAAVDSATGYVNYVYNVQAKGIGLVASQVAGLSGMVGSVIGQLAFQTSAYLSQAESAAMSMGIVASAGLYKATKSAIEFDYAMQKVQAIAGHNNIGNLGEQAIAMSNKFGIAVDEMTEGLESLARAGVSPNNMSGILEQAMGLTKLEDLDLNTAINSLISTTNLLDTEGLSLDSAEYVDAIKKTNQRITATSEAAPINAQDIINTLQHVGGYASSTGIDQDDMFAVIAQLGSKGTRGDMAGTALRALLAAPQKDQAQRALERIGLSPSDLWTDDGQNLMSITDMKDMLDAAMEERGYSKQEKLEFYSDFVGYKQANQIMKIDTSSVNEFKDKIDSSLDMSQKIGMILGTTMTNLQSMGETIKNLFITIGKPLMAMANVIIAPMKMILDVVNFVITKIPGMDWVVAGSVLLVAVKGISTAINKIVPAILSSTQGFKGMRDYVAQTNKEYSKMKELVKSFWPKFEDGKLTIDTSFARQRWRDNFLYDFTTEDWKELIENRENIQGKGMSVNVGKHRLDGLSGKALEDVINYILSENPATDKEMEEQKNRRYARIQTGQSPSIQEEDSKVKVQKELKNTLANLNHELRKLRNVLKPDERKRQQNTFNRKDTDKTYDTLNSGFKMVEKKFDSILNYLSHFSSSDAFSSNITSTVNIDEKFLDKTNKILEDGFNAIINILNPTTPSPDNNKPDSKPSITDEKVVKRKEEKTSTTTQPPIPEKRTSQEVKDSSGILKGKVAFIDTETIGLVQDEFSQITELGVVMTENGKVLKEYSQLVKYEGKRTEETDKFVSSDKFSDKERKQIYGEEEGAMELKDLAKSLKDLIESGTTLVAHNASFDMGMIEKALKSTYDDKTVKELLANAKVIDTLTVSRDRKEYTEVYGDGSFTSTHKQDAMQEHYQKKGYDVKPNENAHRALSDALTLKDIFVAMVQERDDLLDYVNIFGYQEKHKDTTYFVPGIEYVIQNEGGMTDAEHTTPKEYEQAKIREKEANKLKDDTIKELDSIRKILFEIGKYDMQGGTIRGIDKYGREDNRNLQKKDIITLTGLFSSLMTEVNKIEGTFSNEEYGALKDIIFQQALTSSNSVSVANMMQKGLFGDKFSNAYKKVIDEIFGEGSGESWVELIKQQAFGISVDTSGINGTIKEIMVEGSEDDEHAGIFMKPEYENEPKSFSNKGFINDETKGVMNKATPKDVTPNALNLEIDKNIVGENIEVAKTALTFLNLINELIDNPEMMNLSDQVALLKTMPLNAANKMPKPDKIISMISNYLERASDVMVNIGNLSQVQYKRGVEGSEFYHEIKKANYGSNDMSGGLITFLMDDIINDWEKEFGEEAPQNLKDLLRIDKSKDLQKAFKDELNKDDQLFAMVYQKVANIKNDNLVSFLDNLYDSENADRDAIRKAVKEVINPSGRGWGEMMAYIHDSQFNESDISSLQKQIQQKLNIDEQTFNDIVNKKKIYGRDVLKDVREIEEPDDEEKREDMIIKDDMNNVLSLYADTTDEWNEYTDTDTNINDILDNMKSIPAETMGSGYEILPKNDDTELNYYIKKPKDNLPHSNQSAMSESAPAQNWERGNLERKLASERDKLVYFAKSIAGLLYAHKISTEIEGAKGSGMKETSLSKIFDFFGIEYINPGRGSRKDDDYVDSVGTAPTVSETIDRANRFADDIKKQAHLRISEGLTPEEIEELTHIGRENKNLSITDIVTKTSYTPTLRKGKAHQPGLGGEEKIKKSLLPVEGALGFRGGYKEYYEDNENKFQAQEGAVRGKFNPVNQDMANQNAPEDVIPLLYIRKYGDNKGIPDYINRDKKGIIESIDRDEKGTFAHYETPELLLKREVDKYNIETAQSIGTIASEFHLSEADLMGFEDSEVIKKYINDSQFNVPIDFEHYYGGKFDGFNKKRMEIFGSYFRKTIDEKEYLQRKKENRLLEEDRNIDRNSDGTYTIYDLDQLRYDPNMMYMRTMTNFIGKHADLKKGEIAAQYDDNLQYVRDRNLSILKSKTDNEDSFSMHSTLFEDVDLNASILYNNKALLNKYLRMSDLRLANNEVEMKQRKKLAEELQSKLDAGKKLTDEELDFLERQEEFDAMFDVMQRKEEEIKQFLTYLKDIGYIAYSFEGKLTSRPHPTDQGVYTFDELLEEKIIKEITPQLNKKKGKKKAVDETDEELNDRDIDKPRRTRNRRKDSPASPVDAYRIKMQQAIEGYQESFGQYLNPNEDYNPVVLAAHMNKEMQGLLLDAGGELNATQFNDLIKGIKGDINEKVMDSLFYFNTSLRRKVADIYEISEDENAFNIPGESFDVFELFKTDEARDKLHKDLILTRREKLKEIKDNNKKQREQALSEHDENRDVEDIMIAKNDLVNTSAEAHSVRQDKKKKAKKKIGSHFYPTKEEMKLLGLEGVIDVEEARKNGISKDKATDEEMTTFVDTLLQLQNEFATTIDFSGLFEHNYKGLRKKFPNMKDMDIMVESSILTMEIITEYLNTMIDFMDENEKMVDKVQEYSTSNNLAYDDIYQKTRKLVMTDMRPSNPKADKDKWGKMSTTEQEEAWNQYEKDLEAWSPLANAVQGVYDKYRPMENPQNDVDAWNQKTKEEQKQLLKQYEDEKKKWRDVVYSPQFYEELSEAFKSVGQEIPEKITTFLKMTKLNNDTLLGNFQENMLQSVVGDVSNFDFLKTALKPAFISGSSAFLDKKTRIPLPKGVKINNEEDLKRLLELSEEIGYDAFTEQSTMSQSDLISLLITIAKNKQNVGALNSIQENITIPLNEEEIEEESIQEEEDTRREEANHGRRTVRNNRNKRFGKKPRRGMQRQTKGKKGRRRHTGSTTIEETPISQDTVEDTIDEEVVVKKPKKKTKEKRRVRSIFSKLWNYWTDGKERDYQQEGKEYFENTSKSWIERQKEIISSPELRNTPDVVRKRKEKNLKDRKKAYLDAYPYETGLVMGMLPGAYFDEHEESLGLGLEELIYNRQKEAYLDYRGYSTDEEREAGSRAFEKLHPRGEPMVLGPGVDDNLKDKFYQIEKEEWDNYEGVGNKVNIGQRFLGGLYDRGVNRVEEYQADKEQQEKLHGATEKVGKFTEGIGNAKQSIQGLTGFVAQLSELFPPLIIVVMALEFVTTLLGITETVLSTIHTILVMAETVLAAETMTLDVAFAGLVLELLPLIAVVAVIVAGLVLLGVALKASYDAHAQYAESLKKTQKEQASKANKYENEQYRMNKRLQNMQDGPNKNRLEKEKALIDTELDTAATRRLAATMKLVKVNNDPMWGETGLAYKISSLWGGETKHADEYKGVAQSGKEMDEWTSTMWGGLFATDSMRQASAFYKSNEYAYGIMKEYKPELDELYNAQSRYMYRHGGSTEGLEEDTVYKRKKDRIKAKTKLSDEEIDDYLKQMQAEYRVDTAKRGMKAYVGKFKAEADQRQAARLSGMSLEELKSLKNTDFKKYTDLMVQAEADKMQKELEQEMFWRAFYDTITDLAMIVFDIGKLVWDTFNLIATILVSAFNPEWWILVIKSAVWGEDGWKQEDIDKLHAPEKAIDAVKTDMKDMGGRFNDISGVWSEWADSRETGDDIKKAGEETMVDETTRRGMEGKVMAGQGGAAGAYSTGGYGYVGGVNNGGASAQSTGNQQVVSKGVNTQKKTTSTPNINSANVGNAHKTASSTNTQTHKFVAHAQTEKKPIPSGTTVSTPTTNNTTNNNKEGDIVIQNVNINTNDDPEAIKTELMNLIVELKDQISPRIVSRTTGEPATASNTNSNNNNTDNSSSSSSSDNNHDSGGSGSSGSSGAKATHSLQARDNKKPKNGWYNGQLYSNGKIVLNDSYINSLTPEQARAKAKQRNVYTSNTLYKLSVRGSHY